MRTFCGFYFTSSLLVFHPLSWGADLAGDWFMRIEIKLYFLLWTDIFKNSWTWLRNILGTGNGGCISYYFHSKLSHQSRIFRCILSRNVMAQIYPWVTQHVSLKGQWLHPVSIILTSSICEVQQTSKQNIMRSPLPHYYIYAHFENPSDLAPLSLNILFAAQ